MTKLSDLVKKAAGDRGSSPAAPEHSARREIISRSDKGVQELSALYSDLVARLDQALTSVRAGNPAPNLQDAWAAAEKLVPALRTNARILFSLASHDYDERGTAHHSANVFLFTLKAAESLSISDEELATLGQAALFHDIGMALVPEAIVQKKRALSFDEEAEIKKHVDHAAELLKQTGNDLLCTLVRQSHERADGNGYPAGLKDGDIHRLAKLLHAVDSFEAIVHRRAYKSRLTPFEAMKTIKSGVGTHFDGEAFRCLLKAVSAFPIGTLVELNTRERAKVIDINPTQLLKPVVAVLTDAEGNNLPQGRYVDLTENSSVFIGHALVDEELQAKAIDIY